MAVSIPVCWRCLRWGWRLHMRQPSASQTMPSNHSRTAVWRENDNDVVISTAKKPSSPNRNSSAEDINFLREVDCISTPEKVGQQALRSLHLGGLSQSRQPWGLLGKPALPVIACSRLVLLITIRHASPRITPSNIIVLTTTSTESRSELFIRTCMSRYLKLHILSASHKFAYRRESS